VFFKEMPKVIQRPRMKL